MAAPDGYARARLLELLGIEPLAQVAVRDVGGAAPDSHERARRGGDEPVSRRRDGATPDAHAARFTLHVAGEERESYADLLRHLAAALGAGAATFDAGAERHAICFGATSPDPAATLAPPLATLRQSPAAKRTLWRTLRALRAGRKER